MIKNIESNTSSILILYWESPIFPLKKFIREYTVLQKTRSFWAWYLVLIKSESTWKLMTTCWTSVPVLLTLLSMHIWYAYGSFLFFSSSSSHYMKKSTESWVTLFFRSESQITWKSFEIFKEFAGYSPFTSWYPLNLNPVSREAELR